MIDDGALSRPSCLKSVAIATNGIGFATVHEIDDGGRLPAIQTLNLGSCVPSTTFASIDP